MSLISRMRRQKAVYWHLTGFDLNNKAIYDHPLEIKCRWDDRWERDVLDDGEEVDIRSTVYVDRDVVVGGVLWLGLLVDSPDVPPTHNRIKIIRKHPNIRATETLIVARL